MFVYIFVKSIPGSSARLKTKKRLPKLLQCLFMPQSKYTEGSGPSIFDLAKLLLLVIVNRELDKLVGFFTHKDKRIQPTGIGEFKFDKSFMNSKYILNCLTELCPSSLVEI